VLKVELHAHTSDDPADWIPHSAHALIDRAAELGYDALAITLHDHQSDDRSLAAYAANRGIVLIPGMERTIEGRHVLLLNFPAAAAEAVRSFDDVAALKQRYRGLVVAPHPFFPASNCLLGKMNRNADLFDAVEFNAMYTGWVNFNRLAERWSRRRGKPMVGNGDVHRLEQLGTTYSLVDAEERDASSICEAIAAGRVSVAARPLPWWTAIRIFLTMVLSIDRVTATFSPAFSKTNS
jgi:predicted metal-dependent phosphoesterase TrpH